MKTVFLLLPILSLAYTLSAQAPSSQLVRHKRVHDFGTIYEKAGKASYTFTFTNTGKTPILLNGTHSGCGCTSTDYTQLPIKPGGTGKVTVTYNPAHRPGFFSKEVVVFFDDHRSYTRVWVKGTVVPAPRPVEEDHPYNLGQGVHSSLKVLPFGAVRKGTSKEITMFYANNTAREMHLTFAVEGSHPELIFVNPGNLSAHIRGKMTFRYTSSGKSRESRSFHLYPLVDGKKLSVPILVTVTESDP